MPKYLGPAITGLAAVISALCVAVALGVFSAGGAHAAAGMGAGGSGSAVKVPAGVPSAVPTVGTLCTVSFSDVGTDSPYYTYVRCLACRNVLGGYADGSFRPNSQVTRAQLAKMITSAAGFKDALPADRWTFHDIEPGSTFWQYVERANMHGVIGGYNCNPDPTSAEKCDDRNRPYFRPNDNVTRQQVAKMVAVAKGLVTVSRSVPAGTGSNIPAAVPTSVIVSYTFADVKPDNLFYTYVEALARQNTINGYDCGTTNPDTGQPEPCDTAGRKYFRPGSNMSRGQVAKVLSLTFFPECK